MEFTESRLDTFDLKKLLTERVDEFLVIEHPTIKNYKPKISLEWIERKFYSFTFDEENNELFRSRKIIFNEKNIEIFRLDDQKFITPETWESENCDE